MSRQDKGPERLKRMIDLWPAHIRGEMPSVMETFIAHAVAVRKWRWVDQWTMDSEQMPESAVQQDSRPQADIYQANIVTSEARHSAFKNHLPVIDLDCDHVYLPSSTPGHGHIMINVPMSEDQLMHLLDVLAEVGIVQRGYAAASKARGYSAIRLPWVKKYPDHDDTEREAF